MRANVGGSEKVIRIVMGIALLIAGLLHMVTGNLAIAAYVVGEVALVTGVFGFCPAWAVFKVNTCSPRPK